MKWMIRSAMHKQALAWSGARYLLARLWQPQTSPTQSALILPKPAHVRYRRCGQNLSNFFLEETAAIETNVVSDAWWWFRTWSHERKKNRCSYVLFPIFMFCHSRFSFSNLKDANSCMFSWCITTTSLLICSWHDMTLSKSLLFTSIGYVQESFKLNEINHG